MLAGNKIPEAISAAQHFAGCCCVAILTECGSADISRVYPENRCNGTRADAQVVIRPGRGTLRVKSLPKLFNIEMNQGQNTQQDQ